MVMYAHIIKLKDYPDTEVPRIAFYNPDKDTKTHRIYYWDLHYPSRFTYLHSEYKVIKYFGKVPYSDKNLNQMTAQEDRIQNRFVERIRKYHLKHYAVPYMVDMEFKNWNGWLSPEGVFYGCGYMGHTSAASSLVEIFFPKTYDKNTYHVDWEDILAKQGYIRISLSGLSLYYRHMQVTDKQIEMIAKYLKKQEAIGNLGDSLMRSVRYLTEDYQIKEVFDKYFLEKDKEGK